MTLPFEPRPGDPDADHLNTLLDAMRSGSRAPDAASTESPGVADLADAAGQLRKLVRRADAPATASIARFPLYDRWEDILSTATATATVTATALPNAATGGVLRPSRPVSNRTRRLAEPPPSNRLNTWLSAAIVTLMLLGTVGGAWWFGPGQGGPSSDDGIRLAAITQDEATPDTTPVANPGLDAADRWATYPLGQECDVLVDELATDRVAEIRSEPREYPERHYAPFSLPSEEDAVEVAYMARLSTICQRASTEWLFLSERWFYENDNQALPQEHGFRDEDLLSAGMEISAAFANRPLSEFVILLDEPAFGGESQGILYQPHHVVQLADGRMAAVETLGRYEPESGTGTTPVSLQTIYSNAAVFSLNDGTWKIDEYIPFCVGDCYTDWVALADIFGVALPDVSDVEPVEYRAPWNPPFPLVVAPVASPVATPQAATSAPAPLMDLLSAVPASLPDPGRTWVWSYADIEQHFADLGLTPEVIAEDRLLPLGMDAFGPLAGTTGLFNFAADVEFVSAIGFDPYSVEQVLVAGEIPDTLTLLRGDWDEATLTAAWEVAGYTAYETDSGVTIWSLDPEGWIDPDHPIQSRMFQQMNNVAVLDGGILVYAGTMETLELALATHAGEAESAREDAGMTSLLATVPENTISLVALDAPGTEIVDLEAMTQNPNIRQEDLETILGPFDESRDAVGPLPDYHGMIFGITSGSEDDPSVEVFVRLGAGSEEDAAQIATVIEWRWNNFLSQRYQWPLNDVMTLTKATTDGRTVILTFDPLGNPSIWMDLLLGNDLMPFAVDREEPVSSGSPVATPEG